jgi:phospholipid N-methyltransferase
MAVDYARPEVEQPTMSAEETVRCFDSIESAQDFMKILAETILDSMKDLNADQQAAAQDGEPRRAQAIELAIFKLKTLNCHIHKSRIILNDLRTVRRLILNERQPKERAMAATASF